MKRIGLKLGLVAALTVAVTGASAAKQTNFGTGGETGNYFDMANDIATYCPNVKMNIINTTGSVENLNGMTNKKFAMGWVQSDVLKFEKNRQPTKVNKKKIKVIMLGHLETVHVMIPKNYKPQTTGAKKTSMWSSWFGKNDKPNKPLKLDLNALKNQEVITWGGSVVSARAISWAMGLNWRVTDTEKKIIPNRPILLVGGQPYKVVEDILASGKYVLAELNYEAIKQKAPFYKAIDANYKVGSSIVSTPTVAVQALLVGKSLRSKKANKRMSDLAACIHENVGEMADDDETNNNWESVADMHYELLEMDEEDAQSKRFQWSYFKPTKK